VSDAGAVSDTGTVSDTDAAALKAVEAKNPASVVANRQLVEAYEGFTSGSSRNCRARPQPRLADTEARSALRVPAGEGDQLAERLSCAERHLRASILCSLP